MESGFARLAQLGQQKQVWGGSSSSHPAIRIKDTKPRERLRCVSVEAQSAVDVEVPSCGKSRASRE